MERFFNLDRVIAAIPRAACPLDLDVCRCLALETKSLARIAQHMRRDTVFLWLWAIWAALLICGAAYVLMQ